MRLDFADERVLTVVAHPDDAELLCAGTLARAREDGAVVGVCVLCQGDKGQPSTPVPNLATVRRSEATAAAAVLGAELLFGDHPDGELYDTSEARLRLAEHFRQFRPTLVLAHSPNDYHPDHRAAAALADAASWFCASAGRPTASPPLAAAPAVWWLDAINANGFEPEFYVDVSRFVDLKQRMLACHQTQIRRGGDSDFAPLQELMLRQCRSRGAEAGVAAAEAFRTHRSWKRVRAW